MSRKALENTNAYAYSWNLEKYVDFLYFLKAFLSLNRDKYFLYTFTY